MKKTIKKIFKEKEVTGTKEVVTFTSKPTGTKFPVGFDPDLPMNKQREFQ